ncbi:MAG TPA: PPOX class F420-dependent oxidoreductase [Ktedonosporobacter sp.]|jgi:pyridoxamine 5'-phosphate oxidase family protein|nr:PPOX class F420-dependent oxidoreductase [Ktedonosporobacter sp.]
MSKFTTGEIGYLKSQPLGRLATVNAKGEPHVVPVGFWYNAELDAIDIGGFGMGKSKKFRDAAQQKIVAFVVDDTTPDRMPRGIEIRGRVEAFSTGGERLKPGFDQEFIRVFPTRIMSWGIDNEPYHPKGRAV